MDQNIISCLMGLLYIITAFLQTFPVVLIKKYINSKDINFLIVSLICYIFLIISYIYVLNTKNVPVVYSLIKILDILIIYTYGIFYLGEKINLLEHIGIIFAIASIICLTMGKYYS